MTAPPLATPRARSSRRSRFTYDEKSGRFRAANGRYLGRAQVRAAIDAALAATTQRTRVLAESLRTGAIPLSEWQTAMRASIKDAHIYSALAAKGGRQMLSQADYGRIGQRVRVQYGFLEKFARDVEKGLPLDGRFIQRTALYSQSGRGTFEAFKAVEYERRGFDEARSVRHPADSCADCIEQEALGWQPADDMIPIGERECRSNCACTVERRNSATGVVAIF